MNQPLSGLGVLVTRPAHQAGPFISLLQQSGAETFLLPAIEIHAVVPSAELQHRLQLLPYHIVIFISANAVRCGLPLLHKQPDQQIAAIGEGSAHALNELGWQVDLVAEAGFTSEALLALPAFASAALNGKRILIVRGQGGRELLADTLKSRGASVDYAEVYTRQQPQTAIDWLAPLWQKRIHLVCVTSNETLENLYHMLKQYRDPLLQTTLLVPGERGHQLAHSLGFKKIIHAASASDNNMLQRIIEWHNQQLTGA